MWKFELNNGIERHYDDIEALASGLLNVAKARLFIEFIREGKDINPKDIVFDYKKVRPKILQFLKDNDNASLGNIMTSFVTYITTSKPKYLDKEKKNIAKFLVDMPLDSSALYVTIIDNLDRGSPEFMYVTNLHVELLENPDYKHFFYECIVKCGRDKT